MSINLTLVGQALTFLIFILFTMKFVWPSLIAAMQERKAAIADGIAAGERGHYDLKRSREEAQQIIQEAHQKSEQILAAAKNHGVKLEQDAKEKAEVEYCKIIERAEVEVEQLQHKVAAELRKEAANMAIKCSEKILQGNIDKATNSALINELLDEIKTS